MIAGPLSAAVDAVLARAEDDLREDPATVSWVAAQRARLRGPLRIALAGKVKAGKSTLLNGLVGERIAPVDAGECTRVVTWYQTGRYPTITVYPQTGGPEALPVVREDGALHIDLGPRRAADVEHLEVAWPAPALEIATLIDTPGIASLSFDTGRRARRFLDPDDDGPSEADAVVYLMRHLHATDAEFLEAFRQHGVVHTASVNSLAVISRADEIGGGRPDAMSSAMAVARRYRTDPALRGLCQDVVAVAGLIAETGRTLSREEFAAVRDLAQVAREDLDHALFTADRFTGTDIAAPVAALSENRRRSLLRRLGVFGLRLSTVLVRQGVDSPEDLSAELIRRSGLLELQRALDARFIGRRDLLKARSALLGLSNRLEESPSPAGGRLITEVGRILAGAHEFVELRLLAELGSGVVALPDGVTEEARRLLGEDGVPAWQRLDQPAEAGPDELVAAARSAQGRWQARAEDPMLTRAAADACRVVVRTCEGLVAAVTRTPGDAESRDAGSRDAGSRGRRVVR